MSMFFALRRSEAYSLATDFKMASIELSVGLIFTSAVDPPRLLSRASNDAGVSEVVASARYNARNVRAEREHKGRP